MKQQKSFQNSDFKNSFLIHSFQAFCWYSYSFTARMCWTTKFTIEPKKLLPRALREKIKPNGIEGLKLPIPQNKCKG